MTSVLEEERPCEGGRHRSDVATRQGVPTAPKPGRGKEQTLSRRLQRDPALQCPDWDVWLPELYKNTFLGLFFLAIHLVVMCHGSHSGHEYE